MRGRRCAARRGAVRRRRRALSCLRPRRARGGLDGIDATFYPCGRLRESASARTLVRRRQPLAHEQVAPTPTSTIPATRETWRLVENDRGGDRDRRVRQPGEEREDGQHLEVSKRARNVAKLAA